MNITTRLQTAIATITLLTALFSIPFMASAQDADTGLDALVEERLDVLEELVAIARQGHRSGTLSLTEVLTATNELIEAHLETTDAKDVRLELWEGLIVTLRELEAVVTAQHEQGTTLKQDVLRARAARLEAQIGLAREQKG